MNFEFQPTSEPKPGDLERMLGVVFPAEGLRDAARSQLLRYGADSSDLGVTRVRLAILKLSAGDLTRLDKMIDLAVTDYRDVLAEAEYPNYAAMKTSPDKTSPEALAAIEADRRQYQQWLDHS